MRMGMRRFTRLTNGFSQARSRTSRTPFACTSCTTTSPVPTSALKERYPRTPAMAAGVADHVWSLEEIAALLD